MAEITAALVKELREKTGAGMMDCKRALTEVAGDLEAGIDWLRQKGLAKAAKKAGRVAAEGLVAVESAGRHAAMVEVNSETDFVARNDSFQAFAREAAKLALDSDGTLEGLQAKTFPGSSDTVNDTLQGLIATIGENMTLRRVAKLEVAKGVIASYVHGPITPGASLGKIGVLVALESEGNVEFLSTLGRQIAMHVAATNPVALDASGVDPAVLERESNILREKNAGKPDHVMAKIVESGLKSYYKEVTLLEQPFVHDGSKTVSQVLKEAEGKAGAPVTLKAFVRYALGEGIEKEEGPDFAAEVAAMSR
ncbi:elongation factor Ts [Methylobacterium sp. C25]|uniref:translation elongation factor Ts n=1 Tax=Methylobacterium sp. C25 TaxID=2721622 RepID=UPI001F39AD5B|nr:translation elongation factor Ts [Methylobacterium sp. C25]MCE4224132.1 elongation factor Ts [Methylobacterium sp. C25]